MIEPSMLGGPAIMFELIEMSFGMWILVGLRNHVLGLDGGPDDPMPRGNF